MSTSSPSITDFLIVLSESKRILNSHSRHFLALSVLFLLPLSFSFSSFPSLLSLSSSTTTTTTTTTLLRLRSPHHHHHLRLHQFTLAETLAILILFAGFVLVTSVCGLGSITYSVFHGFYSRPVKVGAAVKSLGGSFVRLAATVIAAVVVVGLISVVFGAIGWAGMVGFEAIGVGRDEPWFVGFLGVLGVGLGVVLMYVQVNWGLASVVVVLESKWGFKPLARSRYLIRGMRSVGFALAMFYGGFAGLLVWINVMSGETEFGTDDEWKSWAFVVQIVVTSSILTLLLLHGIAANTVLYMYCKALHGELAGEVAKDFAAEYVSLPYDDEKVSVTVAPSS